MAQNGAIFVFVPPVKFYTSSSVSLRITIDNTVKAISRLWEGRKSVRISVELRYAIVCIITFL